MSLIRNSNRRLFHLFIVMCLIAAGACCYSCANIGRPGGGPRDETPPVVEKSNPLPGTLNYNKNKISIEFDEIVQVENPNEKIIISPPQTKMPQIKALGRTVSITLNDSLIPNTTYSIDFGDAIADNNEKNKLNDFSFYFSTGDHIDTLELAGTLLNAADLEPVSNVLVGIYANLDDTAFTKTPFLRMSRSDERGHFTIRNIAEGTYHIFALKDGNRNYFFDNATEDIAFLDSLFTPTVTLEWRSDTTWVDSVTIDTIITSLQPHYRPDDIILHVFNENFKAAYFEKYERTGRHSVKLYFSAPQDSLPLIEPLNFSDEDWAIIEHSPTNDTITYWLRDSSVYNLDTLNIVARYMRTDSTQQLSPYNDTMQWVYRERVTRRERKKKENDTLPPPIQFLSVDKRSSSTVEINGTPIYIFSQPLARLDKQAVHLDQKVDTSWIPVTEYTFEPAGDTRTYRLQHKWTSGGEYRFTIDSLAATGIYGNFTDDNEHIFKVRAIEEYSNLVIRTLGISDRAFVELLNNTDQVMYKVPVRKGVALFRYINPGTYYMRLCDDANDNGVWDTGNYEEHRQPEMVYYYPGSLSLRANWDIDQTWDVFAEPIDKQKPYEIIKNKPKEAIKKDNSVPEEEQPYYSNQPSFTGTRPATR